MVKSANFIFIEGGGKGKDLMLRCEKAFRQLFEKAGFQGKMPRLVASGGRSRVFADFLTAQRADHTVFAAMLVDSEEPIDPLHSPWQHLKKVDNLTKPENTSDDQVLFMATCMETWIVADRPTLNSFYNSGLQASALPPLANLENRHRHSVQEALERATHRCKNAYRKGKHSFDIVGKLNPEELRRHLPHFVRVMGILGKRL